MNPTKTAKYTFVSEHGSNIENVWHGVRLLKVTKEEQEIIFLVDKNIPGSCRLTLIISSVLRVQKV